MSKKELTEDQLAELKAEKAAKRTARKELVTASKTVVRDYFAGLDQDELSQDLIDAVLVLTAEKTKKAKRAKSPSAATAILTKIKEDGRVSDVDLFMEFKVAQREMAGYIRNWIKKPSNPEDRAWVMFDKDSDDYVLVGEGEFPPENWDGYVPASEEL